MKYMDIKTQNNKQNPNQRLQDATLQLEREIVRVEEQIRSAAEIDTILGKINAGITTLLEDVDIHTEIRYRRNTGEIIIYYKDRATNETGFIGVE